LSTPLSLEIVPLPSFKPPRQTADAFRFIFALCVWSEREFAPTRPSLATVFFHLKRDNGVRLRPWNADERRILAMGYFIVYSALAMQNTFYCAWEHRRLAAPKKFVDFW
jgi:hypothetical protein